MARVARSLGLGAGCCALVVASAAAMTFGAGSASGQVPTATGPFHAPPPAPTNHVPLPLPKPFVIVVMGDSIMTGQALNASHKMTSLVRDWLQTKMPNRPVALYSTAHSGARIAPPMAAGESETIASQLVAVPSWSAPAGLPPITAWFKPKRATNGFAFDIGYDLRAEIPLPFASITRQAQVIGPQALQSQGLTPQDVDLVIMDGGINDVEVGNILTIDPPGANEVLADVKQLWDEVVNGPTAQSPSAGQLLARVQWVADQTHQKATGRMQPLLASILRTYSNARVAFTGYYPIVSTRTPTSQVNELITQFLPGKGAPGGALDVLIAKLAAQSAAFSDTLDADYAQLAQSDPRLVFAPIPWQESFSYGAADTKLGLFQATSDDLFHDRGSVCGANPGIFADPSKPGQFLPQSVGVGICTHAETAHPNIAGAQHFAGAIEHALGPSLCSMLAWPAVSAHASASSVSFNSTACRGKATCAATPSSVTITVKDGGGRTLTTTTQQIKLRKKTTFERETGANNKPHLIPVVTWMLDPIPVEVNGYCPTAVRITLNDTADATPSSSNSNNSNNSNNNSNNNSSGHHGTGTNPRNHCPSGASAHGADCQP